MRGFMKKLSVAAIAFAAVVAVAGTGISADAATKKPTKITLKATSKTVDIKGKVTVSVKSVKPAEASKSVTWKSSNKKVAKVNAKGVVTGVKKGTAKITATSKKNKKVKATITIKVKNYKPKSISLSKKALSLEVGKKKTLTATVKPAGVYYKGITWKSSKKSVATVSSSGKITAKAAGTATITAITQVGGKKATCKVTVTKAAPTEVKATGISFAQKEITLGAKGASTTVTATVTPSNAANKSVKYTSSDENIATVTSDGKVTAINYGTATITAETQDGSAKKAALTVKVVKPEAASTRQVYVSPEWVKSVIDGEQAESKKYVLAEVAWGETADDKAYNAAHVPGAIHINSDAVEYDDCDPWPDGDGYDDFAIYGECKIAPEDNFNIRSGEQLESFLKTHGITKDTVVILYGKSASDSSVTRVAFACLYAGVENVKVIDGGMKTWSAAGLPTETKVNVPTAVADTGIAAIPAHPEYIMGIDQVNEKLKNDENFRLVSIRSYDEFVGNITGYDYIKSGNEGEPEGAIWGHDTDDGTYVNADGTVAGIDNLAAILAESNSSLDNELSFYCGTGWRATIPFLICYQEGMTDISLYDGGWWLWQLKWQKDPVTYPRQQITPEQAANFATMKFAEEAITLEENGTGSNALTITPAHSADIAVKYTSSNEYVATVAEDGTVTARNAGTATITASVAGDDRTATYTVTVENKEAYQFITSAELQQDISSDTPQYVILDVRTASDYATAHVVTAVSADVDSAVSKVDDATAKANLEKAIEGRSADTKYAIVCYSGSRYAQNATRLLKALGLSNDNLYTVQGGFAGRNGAAPNDAWNNTPYVALVESGYNKITSATLLADMQAGTQIYTVLDVRAESDYDTAHITPAIKASVDSDGSASATAETSIANIKNAIGDKTGKYVVVCYSGNAYAQAATTILKGLGVADDQIYTLQGGFGGRGGAAPNATWSSEEYKAYVTFKAE